MAGRMLGVSQSIPDLDGMTLSLQDSITATASGTQVTSAGTSPHLGMHVVTTVASGNDGLLLPILATGTHRCYWYYNNTASNSMQVFGQGTDTIDAVATATGIAIAAQRGRMFYDYAPGKWITFYGA